MLDANLVNQIYNILKRKIVNGELKSGQKINIKIFSQEFKVSPTPIREVLGRLIKDGFIINLSRRGYYVVRIKKRDLEEIYELRQLIEGYSLKYAIQNIRESKLKELLKDISRLKREGKGIEKEEDFYNIDKKLHVMIVRSCPNRRLNKIYLQMFDIVRMVINIDNTKIENTIYLNDCIHLIEAILEKDLLKSKEILKSHINRSLNRLIVILKEV